MKSYSFRFALFFGAVAFVLAACTSEQNLGTRGSQTDSCALASACCTGLSPGLASACQTELSAAQAQSDAQTACGVLLQGYQSEGLCSGASSGGEDGGSQVVGLPDGSPPTSEGGTPSSEGVSLTVQSSREVATVGSYQPPSGQIFVAVAIDLVNGSPSTLPFALPLFSVETTAGLEYPAATETGFYSGGCDPATSLASGHDVACAVVFLTPYGSTTSSIAYQLPDGSHVSAALSTIGCSLCGGACVDLQTDPNNCGSCGNQITQGATCVAGQLVCPGGETACGATCVDTQTDSSNCGGCGKTCGIPGILPVNCLAGQCEACTPGDTGCTSTTSMETCGADGQWGPAQTCSGGDIVCTNNACAASCMAGDTLCGASGCVNTQTDANNCGGCGLACGTTCTKGECIATLTSSGNISTWAVTPAGIYWFDGSGNMNKTPLAGGASVSIASSQTNPSSLGFDASNFYWADWSVDSSGYFSGFTLMQVPLAGGSATPLTTIAAEYLGAVAYAKGTVYWTTTGTIASGYTDGTVMKAVVGGATTPIATAQVYPISIAVDATNVYWATYGTEANSYDDGTVMKAALADGTVTPLATGQVEPILLEVGAAGLSWLTGYEGSNYVTLSVLLLPPGATTPTTLASTTDLMAGAAVDGTTTYWIDQSFYQVMKTLDGAEPTVLYAGTEGTRGVAVDATSVYWLDGSTKNLFKATPK